MEIEFKNKKKDKVVMKENEDGTIEYYDKDLEKKHAKKFQEVKKDERKEEEEDE